MKSRIQKKKRDSKFYTGHYATVCKDGSLWMVFSNLDDARTYLTECPPFMPRDRMNIFKATIVLGEEIT